MNYRLRLEPETDNGQVINEKILKRIFGQATKKKPDGMDLKTLKEIKDMAEFFGVDLKGLLTKKEEKKKEDEKKARMFNFLEMVGLLMVLSLPLGMLEVWLIKAFAATFSTPH